MADIIHRTPAEHEAPLAPDLKTPETTAAQEYEDLIAQQPPPTSAKQKERQQEARDKAKPTANELRAALDARTEQIGRRVEAIQDEVARVPGEVRDAIKQNPLVSLGGSLAGGLLVGLLIGGIGKRKSRIPAAHQSLVAEYLDALGDDVKHAIKKGEDVGKAIKRTVGKHTPLVIVAGGDDGIVKSKNHYLRAGLDMAFKTMLGFGVKMALDKVLLVSGLADEDPAIDRATEGSGTLEVAAARSTE